MAAKATGEYGLKDVTLHYSVNGGPEVAVDLLKKKNERQADGHSDHADARKFPQAGFPAI